MTNDIKTNLLEMADSYDRGGHPDIAAIMRRNAEAITTDPMPMESVALETAEGVIG